MRRRYESRLPQSRGNFVALDFETADYRRDSACALGLVRVERWEVVQSVTTLIRPPRPQFAFSYLHGIRWEHVQDAGDFATTWQRLRPLLRGAEFLAAHNASFDRSVLEACCAAAGLPPPVLPFECSMRLARSVWGITPTRLSHVCARLGLPLKHHDAGSDAEACAGIVVAARRALESSVKLPAHSG